MMDSEKDQKFYVKPIFINFLLLIVNSSLFVIKLIFALLTNSIALQADAFDNLTDIVMVIAALIGIIYSKKKANEKFPYGYYKIENIISLVISLLIFLAAYNIILQSFTDISLFFAGNSKEIVLVPSIFVFLLISILISFSLALYLNIIGKRTKSPIIKSEASEKLFDNFISLSVLISFISAYFNFFLLDSILGFIIALFIIKGGYDIFISSTKTLLDAVIDFNNRTELYKLIEEFPKIKKIENLEIRSYGRYLFLEINVSLNKDMPLSQIELLKNKLSSTIKNGYPEIFKIIIISQTQEKSTIKIAVPVESNEGLNSKIFEYFGESPYFALIVIQEENLLKLELLPNKFAQEEKRKGILISDWLSSEKIDKIYIKQELKKGPYLIFENSLIEMVITDIEDLNGIIRKERELFKYS
ncbi:MAG: cation diffusion facilitator family transporter [Promethearchaeota archaeon]